MGYDNSVAIVSNSESTIKIIKEMLVLLRDVDRVETYDYYDADTIFDKSSPSVIIIHALENDKNAIKLIKRIRAEVGSKNCSIILYPEYEGSDFIIEAFDAGINDILTPPLKDYELVIRVIWAIQKGEETFLRLTENNFLSKLGIIDEQSGFYNLHYGIKYMGCMREIAKEHNVNSSVILLKLNSDNKEVNPSSVSRIIREMLRINDGIVVKDEFEYYVFLFGAKITGLYSLYERMVSSLREYGPVKACAAEVGDETLDDIIDVLNYTMFKFTEDTGFKVIKKNDFIEMFENNSHFALKSEKFAPKTEEKTEKIEETSDIKKSTEYKVRAIKEDFQDNEIEPAQETEPLKTKEDDFDTDFRYSDSLFSEDDKPKALKNVSSNKNFDDADKRVSGLYSQSYRKKLEFVVSPLLKKYAAKFQSEFEFLDANINVEPDSVFMYFDKDDIKLKFDMYYDKMKTVRFELAIIVLGTEIESENVEIEIMDLDHEKLDIILKMLTDEYRNYLPS